MDQATLKKIDKMYEMLDQQAKTPTQPSARKMFGGWNGNWQDDPWPEEKLKRLAPYDKGAVDLLTKKGRDPRISGIGHFLVKAVGMAARQVGRNDVLDLIRSSCDCWDDNYNLEHFHKEYGGAGGRVREAASPYVVKGFGGREVTKAALAENSGTTGGYLIPPQFMNELLTIAAEDGFIEPRAKVVPMNTRTVQWPMLDITTVQSTGTTPYYGGILAAWQAEASQINETEPTFRQTDWTAWDLVLYTVSSNQLLADNGIGLDALLTQLFGAAITWYKEYAYLNGKGAGSTMPLGVLNAPATIQVTRQVASHFTFKDAATMMSKLQIRSWNDACWMAHYSVLPDFVQMTDISTAPPGSAGQHLTWLPPWGNNNIGPAGMKMPNTFFNGLPLIFTEKLPQLGTTGCVMLVDWSRYVIGMRLDLQIDVSPHFLFRNNQLAWRVVARLDGKPWLNNAITDAQGFTVSPFVVVTQ